MHACRCGHSSPSRARKPRGPSCTGVVAGTSSSSYGTGKSSDGWIYLNRKRHLYYTERKPNLKLYRWVRHRHGHAMLKRKRFIPVAAPVICLCIILQNLSRIVYFPLSLMKATHTLIKHHSLSSAHAATNVRAGDSHLLSYSCKAALRP